MSKKWTNPPPALKIRSSTASSGGEDGRELQRPDPLSVITILPPEGVNSTSLSHRDSTLSDAQYAFAGPTNQYLDLPSAVPFQDFLSPALPSAEFPSSVRGLVSLPGTSSTSNFPEPSNHHAIVIYNATSAGNDLQPNPALSSDHETRPTSAHPIVPTPTAGATALSRANSSVSYDSVWSGEGSQQHISLDITQFPRPPDTVSEGLLSTRLPPNVASLVSNRKQTWLKPPASPLYEESEPSVSRPLTPNVGEVSYQYPVGSSDQQQSLSSLEQPQDAHSGDSLVIQYLQPRSDAGNGLMPPSPAPTSARGSYQSQVTAASRGSSSPRMSIGDAPPRASAVPESSQAWDEVMNSVKPHWKSSETLHGEASTPQSFVMSAISTNAAVDTSSAGQEDGVTINVPPLLVNTLLSPLSGESTSDVYSVLGRMSFPKPPTPHIPSEEQSASPISPGPPRSPWVTGLTLKTKSSRGSLATLKRRPEESPMNSPLVPPLPAPFKEPSTYMSTVVPPHPIVITPADHVAIAYLSSRVNGDRQQPSNAEESRNSSQSGWCFSYTSCS